MSKSIYEETLTELETWKATSALDQEQLEKIDEHIEVMKKAVKQEKLLELYRELITVKNKLIFWNGFGGDYFVIREKENNLEKEIRELVNNE